MIKKLSLLAASLVLAASAQALPVSVKSSFGMVSPPGPLVGGGPLALFDGGGAINLDSASIRLDWSSTATITVTTKGLDNASETVAGEMITSFSSLTNTDLDDYFSSRSSSEPFSKNVTLLSRTASDSILVEDSGFIEYDVLGSDLGYFQSGPGSFLVSCSSALSFFDDLFLLTASGLPVTTCSATITYNYDDGTTDPVNGVPEPSSLALFGLALAGLGAMSRRRKA